jgi:regulator of replication initiation timing
VGELRARLAAREGELERAQRELAGLRQSVAARGQEAQGERDALARLRQELADSRAREQAAAGRLRALEQSVADREARLAARERELGDLRAALQRSQGESEARRAEVERLRREAAAESGARRAELERREREAAAALGRAQQELDALRRAEAERRAQAETERGAVERARQELADSRSREQAAGARLRELTRAVQEREGRLAARERELADLRVQLERSEQASRALRAELDQLRTQTAAAGPEIHLIEPELIATRGTRAARAPEAADRLMVVGRVDSPGGLLSLLVNGREERLDGNVFKTQVAVRRSADERVQIVAIDRAGRRSALEFLVLARPEPAVAAAPALPGQVGWTVLGDRAPFGRYHALVIGNNDYRHLKRLRTAVNDAREVARVLERRYGFTVTLLVNATRYEVLSVLNQLRESLTEKDNLLVYYAGHGEIDQKNQRGHWLPVDAEPSSTANWISNVQVTDVLNAMTTQQLLVVADSCYAGTLTRSALGRLEGGMSEAERLRVIQNLAQKRSRMVLSSGGVEPVLDSAGGPHSAFAQIFLDLLQQNVGVLPGQDLFRLLQLRVAAIAQRLETSQVPEYAPIKYAGHESGDFFFVRAGN